MKNNELIIIVITILLGFCIVAGAILISNNGSNSLNNTSVVNNTVNNTTTDNLNVTRVNNEDTGSGDSVNSKSGGSKYPSGLSDAEIEAYIERDRQNSKGHFVYEDARAFYENVPPSGMG